MAQVSLPTTRPRSKEVRREGDARSSAAWLVNLALIAAFLTLTFLLGCFPLKDTDFWWHLKAGDQIRQTWKVPTVDTYTFAAQGHPWVDLHWGFQVLLSWGFERGGVVGLNVGKCLITCLAMLLLITARRPTWPLWGILLAWIPALLLLSGRMYIRPETLSLLYLAAELAILQRWDRRPALAFALPIIQLVWVNSHGLFILGPIVITFALIDATLRRGALDPERRGWWRKILAAVALTGLVCLINPYGLTGALYPLQLARTMADPEFQSIAELESLKHFYDRDGLQNLTFQLHFVVMALGALSFLVPLVWMGYAKLKDRHLTPPVEAKKAKAKKKGKAEVGDETSSGWRLSPFRLLLFGAFSYLSFLALRNSNQYAAVVGTVTAWNVGEWLGAIQARKARINPSSTLVERRAWAPVLSFAVIVATIVTVATGQLYAWAKEGRTIGLGEEPLWFPHEAVKFAGSAGMPDRLVAYHNGLAPLYEYYFAPDRKAYTDARLEVMGVDVYKEYRALGRRIETKAPGWSEELEAMGKPAILVDNMPEGSSEMVASLLTSRRWRCVWFDPKAALFVHDSLKTIIKDHEVDFLARHFQEVVANSKDDAATLLANAKALRMITTRLVAKPGGEGMTRGLILLGLDYARQLRDKNPGDLDGWKQAGLLAGFRDQLLGEKPIARFRMPFEPEIDLPLVRPTSELVRALQIAPRDHLSLLTLARLFQSQAMDDSALPILERYLELPMINDSQRQMRAMTADAAAKLRLQFHDQVKTQWSSLSDLDRVVSELNAKGRVSALADLIESAYRPEARPWEWADRLAVLRLHLGEPAKARAAWLAATGANVPEAIRTARVAASYLVEDDFVSSRNTYHQALALDPNLYEAHYGLALLEMDDGRANQALVEARLADQTAANPNARLAARAIVQTVAPYARAKPEP